MASDIRTRVTHPAWGTAIWTAVGYAVILLVLFIGLFVVPYLLFSLL